MGARGAARRSPPSLPARAKSALSGAYMGACRFLKWLTLTLTLLAMPPLAASLLWWTLASFDLGRAAASAVALWAVTYVNSKV